MSLRRATPAEVLELPVALRRENPERTAAIARILRTQLGWAPDERTLQRNFQGLGLTGATTGSAPAVFGQFEARVPERPVDWGCVARHVNW